jgi:hypothetical protein
MRLFVGAVLAMSLAGCLDESKPDGLAKATKDVEGIVIAANSPDAAVKSWWAVKDAGIRLDREICAEYQKSTAPVNDKLRGLASEAFPFFEKCSVTHAYERKIAKVEVESETRAVVSAVIKNVEPPEPGAEYDDSDRKAKESGERFRYTLERQKATDGWRISSIEHFPSYARDWEEAYSKRKPSNNRYIFEQLQ